MDVSPDPLGSPASGHPVSVKRVIRRVMLGQMLFTAGNALTTGVFFTYFVYEFHPSTLLLSVTMIAPETSQALSVLGRRIALKRQRRKWIWVRYLLASRLAALLIPLALLWPNSGATAGPVLFILACTATWYMLQGIAYVNYISWLSDLVPDVRWGRLFSRRQMAGLLVSVGVPLTIAYARRHYLQGLSPTAAHASYAVIFTVGGILVLISILPLLSLPDVPWRPAQSVQGKNIWEFVCRRGDFRLLLASRWWLAFFQGLTQAVLFRYAVDRLHVPVEEYTLLISLMLVTQLPLTWWGGRLSDAGRDKQGYVWGLLAVSCALPLWIWSTPQTRGLLYLAYALWGAFGIVNVCGTNLCLKLSPAGDNAGQFALYEQVAGLIAGGAGLLGGYALDLLMQSTTSAWSLYGLDAFQMLFFVSWLGRLTAPLWVISLRQPPPRTRGESLSAGIDSGD